MNSAHSLRRSDSFGNYSSAARNRRLFLDPLCDELNLVF